MGRQGMNTGIQDAIDLGWKLALVLKRRASHDLLTTYGRDRLPVIRGGDDENPVVRATPTPATPATRTVVNFHGDAGEADALVAEIEQAGGEAAAVEADVSGPGGIAALFDAAEEAFGPVTLLVNNAATRGDGKSAAEIDLAAYEKVFDVNARGPILCLAEFARRARSGGRVVNITSGQARTPMPGSGLYAGAKGALESVTRAFAADLGPAGITVNAVAPGATATDAFTAEVRRKEKQEQAVRSTALGRLGTPGDVAAVVSFLLSDDAGWVTGQVIDVNGGLRRG